MWDLFQQKNWLVIPHLYIFDLNTNIKNTYKKSFTLQGRTSVLEFWSFQLFYWLVMLPLILKGMSEGELSNLLGPFILGSAPAQVSLQIRRIHDLGWSGWCWLLPFIPVVGSLIMVIIYLFPGNDERNNSGANKKWYEDSFPEDTA